MLVKQTVHFDGQFRWFTYQPTLPAPNARKKKSKSATPKHIAVRFIDNLSLV